MAEPPGRQSRLAPRGWHAGAGAARADGDGARPRAAVERMAAYDPAESATSERPPRIRLDSNENPYGPSPRVAEALGQLSCAHQYPDPEQKALRRAIADYADVPPDQVLAGSGSDELIDLLCRIYLEPGDEVIDCTPTFGMYRFSTELCGGVIAEAPRDGDWRLDLDAVRAAITPRTRLVFLASPNNPTGTQEPEPALRQLLDTSLLVVLDEAYIEFSRQPSLAGLVAEHRNLVVLRTFSKWAGLAGLRVGYCIAPGEVLRSLWKVKPPFNVNAAAEAAVAATLADLPLMRERIERIVQERERMAEGLSELPGVRVWPSEGNFLLVTHQPGPQGLKDHLKRQGISVRSYTHPRLHDAFRVSVGLPHETDELLRAAREWAERHG